MPDESRAPGRAAFGVVWRRLQEGGHAPPYLLIDCAGVEGGRSRVPWHAFAESESVFTGDLAIELADVGPYLARLKAFDASCEEVARHLLETHVALLVILPAAGNGAIAFSQLHRHFRKFNVVYDSGGKPLFFRYYDPRVLVDVLKVLTGPQLDGFFGPIESLILVDAQGETRRYRNVAGELSAAS